MIPQHRHCCEHSMCRGKDKDRGPRTAAQKEAPESGRRRHGSKEDRIKSPVKVAERGGGCVTDTSSGEEAELPGVAPEQTHQVQGGDGGRDQGQVTAGHLQVAPPWRAALHPPCPGTVVCPHPPRRRSGGNRPRLLPRRKWSGRGRVSSSWTITPDRDAGGSQ